MLRGGGGGATSSLTRYSFDIKILGILSHALKMNSVVLGRKPKLSLFSAVGENLAPKTGTKWKRLFWWRVVTVMIAIIFTSPLCTALNWWRNPNKVKSTNAITGKTTTANNQFWSDPKMHNFWSYPISLTVLRLIPVEGWFIITVRTPKGRRNW